VYNKDIFIIDFETTGTLERTKPTRIIQVGISKLNEYGLIRFWESDVNPQESLDEFIVNYTGLTDEKLSKEPKFSEEVESEITGILKGELIAAWPISFEMPILQWEYANAGLKFPLDRRGIDIGTLARYYMAVNKIALKPIDERNVYSLDNVLNSLGFPPVTKRHSALEDSYFEGLVLQKILYGN
jgi:DNA polymerase III alpha subunit (gram-positive type)